MEQQHRFHDIEQFRTTVKTVKNRAEHHKVVPPKLIFHGTVKLHGTNMSVVYNHSGKYQTQSRETIITVDDDINGFASFANRPVTKQQLQHLAISAREYYLELRDIKRNVYIGAEYIDVVIYGEWCGKGIFDGTAISQLHKIFVIFAIKIIIHTDRIKENKRANWLTPLELLETFNATKAEGYISPVQGVNLFYCIEQFKTYKIEIDFSNPEHSVEELTRITTEVELECPVAAELGIKGMGEGVVWTYDGGDHTPIRTDDLIFKVKGEKHSDTKNSSICSVDIERRNSIEELASSFITDHRLEKGINYLFECGTNNIYDISNIGHFLKWVGGDIIKEETDTIIGNGFEVKELTKAVNILAKKWFLDKIGIKK